MNLDELFRGQPSRSKWEALGRYLKSQRLIGGVGVRISRDATHGTVISAGKRVPGAVAAAEPKPLTLRGGTTAAKLQVIPGYANALMPTLAGVALDAEVPPEITVAADVWVWLKCVGTFGVSDSYVFTIETSATSAVPAGTAITGTGFVSYLLIGAATFADDAATITQNRLGGDVGVESFGANNLWWQL